ncbi:FtsX-like permease family protein [Rhodocytophaga rosea]|uniref:FtsX-like permease family protein n=1 Tax=Rhodocytophaga rosea TaxID=2704465 RepID=A0A6C0GMC6_9BACT|nr:ABC transporter permease [Rhodocytophaga rosea]QHT69221.1 FtsX-like permease family protein [Rhodocytophaga rosea]
MFTNYFTIAFRNLLRHKVFSLINILGLAIGMAACLLIVLFITDELSFDQQQANKNRIYRVEGKSARGGQTLEPFAQSNFGLAPLLKTAFPQIEKYVRMEIRRDLVKYQDKQHIEEGIAFADSTFFDIFSFPFVKGNPHQVLNGPNTAVITEAIAQKYFGTQNPLGQLLDINGNTVKVTGVIEEMPRNSHFQVNFVVSVQTIEAGYPDWMRHPSSGGTSHYTYLLLPENYNSHQIEAQLEAFTAKYIGEEAPKYMQFKLQPLTKIHLYSQSGDQIQANGSITYIYVFAAVALIILSIACINYMNLTTARSIERAKEVGLRKVVGANKSQLIVQFLGESVFITTCAMVIAYLLAIVAMPWFNDLSNKQLSVDLTGNIWLLIGLLSFSWIVGLLAGSYPAFFLSAFKMTSVLKGNVTKTGSSSLLLRKSLVVVQFCISITLIVSTLLIYKQMQFIRTKNLGIHAEQVITVPLSANVSGKFEALKTELLKNSNVLGVTGAINELTSGNTHWRQYDVKKNAIEGVSIATMDVDADFFKTMQAQIIAGRGFSKDFPSDVKDAWVVNETAAKFLNLENPVNEPMAGSIFNGKDWSKKEGRIIGVVKDFHFSSLHSEIKPVVFNVTSPISYPLQFMWVRIQGNQMPATIDFIERTWKQFEAEFPLSYSFMDEDIASLYRSEERFLQVFIAFAVLAIFIACLGIFGLASYTATQRTREIGIRKVLGASVSSIVLLLSKDFTRLVLISFVIATPVGWYIMKQWLQNFAYQVDMGITVFVISGLCALIIAWLTVSFQSIKAALSNPVKSLRNE